MATNDGRSSASCIIAITQYAALIYLKQQANNTNRPTSITMRRRRRKKESRRRVMLMVSVQMIAVRYAVCLL